MKYERKAGAVEWWSGRGGMKEWWRAGVVEWSSGEIRRASCRERV